MFKLDNPEKVTPEQLNKAAKRFEWLVGFMTIQFKFVHHILLMMHKVPANGMGTFGVRVTDQGRFELYYDPYLTIHLTDAELTYIFYHEILHLALHHCTKRPLTSDKKDKHLANVAHDLAINELIPEDQDCQKPKFENGKVCGTFVSELKKMKEYEDIEEKQSAEWYWDYLQKKRNELDGKLPGIEMPECDGDCKNCKAEQAKGGSGDMTAKDGCPKGFDDHGGWKEHEVADERVTQKINEINRNDGWGSVSQGMREIIMAAQIKKVNWRNLIRVWFGNHIWKDRQSTRKRPNRRTGFMHPGYRRQYTDKYLVAADTSGSVGPDLLAEWVGVINQLVETVPIDFMQFDCHKQTDPVPYDRRKLELEFKGRGGTDFQPVMNLVNERHYKGVMILTDGQASPPTAPKAAHVLWVLPIGCNPPVDWGDRVYLERHV